MPSCTIGYRRMRDGDLLMFVDWRGVDVREQDWKPVQAQPEGCGNRHLTLGLTPR